MYKVKLDSLLEEPIGKLDIYANTGQGEIEFKGNTLIYYTRELTKDVFSLSNTAKGKTEKIYVEFRGIQNKEIVGYKNISKFVKEHDKYLFVRSKKDIAPDIPPYTKLFYDIEEDQETFDTIANMYTNNQSSYSQLCIAQIAPQVYNENLDPTFANNRMYYLIYLLTEVIPEDEKVILYTPYTQAVSAVQKILEANNIKVLIISGKVS